MKALITGITGLRNRGVEALLVTTIDRLSQRRPNLTFNVLTDTPDYDEEWLKRDNVKFFDTQKKRWKQKLRFKGSKLYKPLASEYSLFKEASIVIASGGDMFTSDYPGVLRSQLQPIKLALHAGTPVVFLGQSISFKRDDDARAWVDVARRSSLITVREEISYKYVTKDLGLPQDLVKHTADSAFLLEPSPSEAVSNLFQSYGIIPDKPVVAIAPSQGISRYGDSDYDKHLETWCRVVNLIINEFDAQVLIVPHSQNINPKDDDRIIATKLFQKLDYNPRIHLAGADHSGAEFKGLISASDFLIAERMHAAIAGLSSAVCTVVVGYSVKAEGIMTDLLEKDLVQDSLLVSIQNFLDADLACAMIRKAWSQRNEVSSQLKHVLPKVKQNAAENFELVSAILN